MIAVSSATYPTAIVMYHALGASPTLYIYIYKHFNLAYSSLYTT